MRMEELSTARQTTEDVPSAREPSWPVPNAASTPLPPAAFGKDFTEGSCRGGIAIFREPTCMLTRNEMTLVLGERDAPPQWRCS